MHGIIRLHAARRVSQDTFEQFLNVQYKTTKRFGVDGGEAAVAGVNAAIEKASGLGMREAVIGMPHRGRLNVLTNVVRKPLVQMFAEFKAGFKGY